MIEILQTRVLRGPNVWARVPVIHLTLSLGDLEDRPTSSIPGFVDRLLAVIPTLEEHTGPIGSRGAFVEQMREEASVAAVGAHVSIACIHPSLRTFSTAFWQTPGRFNVVEIEGKQVVVDHCHNVDGLRWIGDFVDRTAAPRSIGVIAIAGDRRDEDIREFGALAGRIFDDLVIREHDDRRGRNPGEVASMLREAAIAGGTSPDQTTVILDEIEAVHAAIDLAEPGDLVVAMVYRIPKVWEALAHRQEQESRGRLTFRHRRSVRQPRQGRYPCRHRDERAAGPGLPPATRRGIT